MKKKNFKLALFGKRYEDHIFSISTFKKGETNIAKSTETQLGGIYNINRLKFPQLETTPFEEGSVEAIIVSEFKNSKRSSILYNPQSFKKKDTSWEKFHDWTHLAYVDDIHSDYLPCFSHSNVSIDFCTLDSREKYLPIIHACSVVFDSRERKPLYSKIKTKTPLIFHDEYGCECVINGKLTHSFKSNPIKGLQVNGAGDIFCGIFIFQLYNIGLKAAINTSCEKTTNQLKLKYEKI